MAEYFKDIPKIKYEGVNSTNPLSFKYYNPDEVVMGKTMREQLKFALSWWHTMGGDGTDMFGCGTTDKTWGEAAPEARAKKKVDVAFEIMDKLSIDYFCFHDRDLSPEYGDLGTTNAKLAEVVDYIAEKMAADPTKKLLWGTAKCFDHPRYMHGAGTSPSADVFAYAAAQIKNAVDATIKLGGKGYVFWGGREGYETLLNTNMGLELDNMARLMKLTVDYARSKGYTGDFYIEPKPKEPTKHQYDFDTATVLGFLRKYGLDKDFKMNIEANHATLAQHTFQHELRVARDNGVFGSIDANQGDPLLGWDTDQFPTNAYDATLCMYEVLKAGGVKTTTIAMLLLTVLCVLKNKRDTECFARKIDNNIVRSGITITMITLIFLMSGITALTIFEPGIDFLDLTYEAASAMGTVGLTADLTPILSRGSHVILMILMYVGRIGPLTMALALSGRSDKISKFRELPEENVMLG